MPKKFKKDWSSINNRIKNRKNKFKADERIFVATYNDKNACKVVMRLLDAPDIDMPYAEQSSHFFSDVGGWFIDNCPSSIGEKCPVCEDLYANNYYETENEMYFERKKNTYFYTNVLIIDDTNNPSNNGKVFILKFGAKIMEKIEDIIEEGKQPWDDDCGVNFTFSAKKKNKMPNYDASRFSDSETSVSEYGDEDAILKDRHDLAKFTDEDEFKSFEELKKKYEKVIGETSSDGGGSKKKRRAPVEEDVEEENDIVEDDFGDDIGDDTMIDGDDDDGFFDDLEDDGGDED